MGGTQGKVFAHEPSHRPHLSTSFPNQFLDFSEAIDMLRFDRIRRTTCYLKKDPDLANGVLFWTTVTAKDLTIIP